MKTRLIALSLFTALGCALRGGATTPTEDRLWATRITCELQTAGPASLPALHWQQGTSPLLSFDQYRSGRAVDADTNVTAVLRLAPTATNLAGWVSVTNYATVGNGYLIQMPTVGTNTAASGAWWYTAYFIRGTAVYWTGSGRVTITATTSTGADGLVWQEILPSSSIAAAWDEITGKPATFPPEAHRHDYTAITNPPWLTEYTETDEIALSRVTVLEGKTNNWDTAFGWGNHAGLYKAIGWVPSWAEVTGKPDLFDWNYDSLTNKPSVFPPSAHTHPYTDITEPPWLTSFTEQDEIALQAVFTHTNNEAIHLSTEQAERIANAVTNEQDLAALRAYHYGSPDIVESPAGRFGFNAATGAISSYNYEPGRENVVIPWQIGGVPVVKIGENAFLQVPITNCCLGKGVTSIGASAFLGCPDLASVNFQSVTAICENAFYGCISLASLTIPDSIVSIGSGAFANCVELGSVYFSSAAPIVGALIFDGITENQITNYVTNPHATGWGEKLGGMPVVRLPLYADAIYQAGELVATTGHVAQAIAAIEFPVTSTNYTAWTGTVTPADGTATVTIAHGNMPVLVTDAPCVLTLDPTGYGTAGVSRVSLSYYTGTNSFTFSTNVIKYAETPTVDTNGWNTLLIRRVSNGAWKGVGL